MKREDRDEAAGGEGEAMTGEREARHVEALLTGALRSDALDPDARDAALAAFRAARDAGEHRAARVRRRDDWSPRERRRFALRTAGVGAVLAGVTLGGVAVAEIGAPRKQSPEAPAERQDVVPSAAPAKPGPDAMPPDADRAVTPRPRSAKDTEADCRASGKSGGKPSRSTARRSSAAPAGEEAVEAACVQRSGDDAPAGGRRNPSESGHGKPGDAKAKPRDSKPSDVPPGRR